MNTIYYDNGPFFSVIPRFFYGRDLVRELPQFHASITVRGDIQLETLHTDYEGGASA